MGLEQLENQIVNKLDYINDLENTIRECLFIMKDGFLESKRFELYQKKRERELLDFFYSYYKDISCENLPESIQELPLYLIEKEYEFISNVGHMTPLFIEFGEEEFMDVCENLDLLSQDIYRDQYEYAMQVYWYHICTNWLKVCIRREDVVEQNFIRFAAFDHSEVMWFILSLLSRKAMELLRNMLESEKLEDHVQVYERQKQEYEQVMEEKAALTKDIENLKHLTQLYQKKIQALQEESQRSAETSSQKENKKLRGQVRKLMSELEKVKERNQALSNENEKLVEELKVRNQTIEAEVQDGVDYEGRYLFVGGHYNVVDNLRDLFPNAKFILKETENVSTSTFYQLDGVIYLSKFMNHCMYNNIRKECQRLGIRQYHISKTRTEAILQELKNWRKEPLEA